MKLNYVVCDAKIIDNEDVNELDITLKGFFDNNATYMDEVVVNLFVENEMLLEDCVSVIEKYQFGVLCRLPLTNLYFDLQNIWCIKNINNKIYNFLTPILKVDIAEKNIKAIQDVMELFKKKSWKLYIYIDVTTICELEKGIELYKRLKCEFFDDEFCIIFNLAEDTEILKYAYFNIEYIVDTIKFLGMRDNVIVDCLLKAIREKELGIKQAFACSYRESMQMLMQYELINYYNKRTLVRDTMDDFALT